MQGAPFLIKMGSKPVEVKRQNDWGRKRAGVLLLKIQNSGGSETQPLPFTLGLTCQNRVDPRGTNPLHSQHFQFSQKQMPGVFPLPTPSVLAI